MGVVQIDRLLSSLLSLCAQVGELEKENQGLRATLELARTANTHWSVSSGKQDKELQRRQAEIEKLKVDLAKVRCCVSFSSDSTLTPTPASIVSSDIFAEIRNRRSCKPSVLRNVSGPGLAFSRSPLRQHRQSSDTDSVPVGQLLALHRDTTGNRCECEWVLKGCMRPHLGTSNEAAARRSRVPSQQLLALLPRRWTNIYGLSSLGTK